jgi:type II secretory pathway pseudopilin PulG
VVRRLHSSLSLIEIVVCIGIASGATLVLLQSLTGAVQTSAEADREQLSHDHAEAVAEIARRSELLGPTGLVALCGANGLVVQHTRHPSLVAVIRTSGTPTSIYEVDLPNTGVPNTTRRVIRLHVQTLWVSNPLAAAPALTPATGEGFPRPLDQAVYRSFD